jgi:alkylation response protein AidB-like acyl-CoA dehydrogenase
MDLSLSPEQLELHAAIGKLLDRHRKLPQALPVHRVESADLQRDLADAGYLDVARTEGFGPVDAVLLVAAIAQLPYVMEAGASALVAPLPHH